MFIDWKENRMTLATDFIAMSKKVKLSEQFTYRRQCVLFVVWSSDKRHSSEWKSISCLQTLESCGWTRAKQMLSWHFLFTGYCPPWIHFTRPNSGQENVCHIENQNTKIGCFEWQSTSISIHPCMVQCNVYGAFIIPIHYIIILSIMPLYRSIIYLLTWHRPIFICFLAWNRL